MRGYVWFCLLFAATVGCRGTPSEAPKVAKSVSVDASSTPAQAVAPTDAQLQGLFPATPGLPVILAGVRFDQDQAAVTKRVPGFDKAGTISTGVPGVTLSAAYHRDNHMLRYVRLVAPGALGAALEARWGAPVLGKLGRDDVRFWFDADQGLQLSLRLDGDRAELTTIYYRPWRMVLGTDPKRLGFERAPLLGMTAAQVLEVYGDLRARRLGEEALELRLPPYEFSDEALRVHLDLKAGKVSRIAFQLGYRNFPAMGKQIGEVITRKLGAGRDEGMVEIFGEGPVYRIRDQAQTHRFRFEVVP